MLEKGALGLTRYKTSTNGTGETATGRQNGLLWRDSDIQGALNISRASTLSDGHLRADNRRTASMAGYS